MHEQEFERSVQQKMEELSFTPSAPVWEKLEKELRTKKRRRRFALWLLPAVLSGLAVGFWLYNGGVFNMQDTISENKRIQNRTVENRNQPPIATKQKNLPTANKINKGEQEIGLNANSNVTEKSIDLLDKRSKALYSQQSGIHEITNVKTRTAKPLAVPHSNGDVATTHVIASENRQDESGSIAANKNSPVPLYIQQATFNLQNLQGLQNIQPVLLSNYKKKASSVSWQSGFELQYGWADTHTGGFFDGSKAESLNDLLPNSPGGFNGVSNRQRSLQTVSGGFVTTAFFLQHNLNNRISFVTGIRYSLFTLRSRVGEKISRSNFNLNNASADAIASRALYKPDTASSYFKNRFHQVSVPLLLQVRPFKKSPLETAAGVALGYLSSSNILRYDTAARVYYASKPSVQHLQVQAQASIKYRLAQTNKWQWHAVTQMHFHLSHLYTTGSVNKKLYALSAGIQVGKK